MGSRGSIITYQRRSMRRCLTTAVAARRKMKIMKPFLDVLGLISASLL
eukprot:COSAG06_NODE_1991_length_7895_cov_3.685736_1_plen_47_part_10